jgi:hypothetical protein
LAALAVKETSFSGIFEGLFWKYLKSNSNETAKQAKVYKGILIAISWRPMRLQISAFL